jgi:hypothetical protein
LKLRDETILKIKEILEKEGISEEQKLKELANYYENPPKIIFLDFDGVINCEIDYPTDPDKEPPEDISRRCIKLLNSLIEETEAKVVISSVWRNNRSVKDLQQLLEIYGFKGEVIGKTPHIKGGVRGNEIVHWIKDNFEYTERERLRYVILDDDSDMLFQQKDNFISIDAYCGITPKVVNKAAFILNRIVL